MNASLTEVIWITIKVSSMRAWVAIKNKLSPRHTHYFRKGDVMANPESDYCRCYLCGENVNIMETPK